MYWICILYWWSEHICQTWTVGLELCSSQQLAKNNCDVIDVVNTGIIDSEIESAARMKTCLLARNICVHFSVVELLIIQFYITLKQGQGNTAVYQVFIYHQSISKHKCTKNKFLKYMFLTKTRKKQCWNTTKINAEYFYLQKHDFN